jgi:hypothetical protein
MIPPEIQLLALFVVALLTQSRTYTLIAVFSFINLVADQFTTSDYLYLMVVYVAIDYLTAMAILKYGDIDKVKQSLILIGMVMLHVLLEIDQTYETSIVFDWYVYGVSALILAQIAGARRGMDRNYSTIHGAYLSPFDIFKDALFGGKTWNLSLEDKKW